MKKTTLLSMAILLLFCSCERKSTLSEGKVEDLSLIGANIQMTQSLTNHKNKSVQVEANLYDKDGYAIDNDSIKIKVNGVDLILRKIPGMGLNDYEYISYEKIPYSNDYTFEIILTNGASHFLGTIHSIEESNENDIVCDEKGDLNKDCIITWKNLKEINKLEINKNVKLNKPDSTNCIYITGLDEIIKKIDSKGKYIIPKAEYIKPESTINLIGFDFKAEKSGKTNHKLLEGSEIKISGQIEKIISFEKP